MSVLEIEINLSVSGATAVLYSGFVKTRSSGNHADKIFITNKKILINCVRSSIGPDPLKSHNSTFHKIIVKGLALYFLLTCKPAKIKNLILRRFGSNDKFISELTVPSADIAQTTHASANLSAVSKIDPLKAILLLEETPVARSVLYATTHLIKANDARNVFDRFDRLWRAFNSLYRAYSGKTTDTDCHIFLANDIRQNPASYPLAIASISGLTSAMIRTKVRWILMLQNNYPTAKRTKSLKESILRTKDSRILTIYRDTLTVREKFLKAEKHYTAVDSHIKTELAAPSINNSDVVVTLCIKYMYYVRNKIAHAERADHGFSFLLDHAEQKELDWLNPMLEALVIDLINISDQF
ncbi:hypothetical protein [Comamonas terrae]|uniref:Apea-like HEPN domain-containing protein n=1 Tax=Comamonas terrae TaxID=673548 RepID=A0ABW5UP80_9BURK|nr:hypothetical protein [Comamonas terrae]